MKLRAVNDRIIIIRDNAVEKKTNSGLVIPAAVQDQPQTAVVVDVGSGKFQETANAGGTVHEKKYTPMPVKIGDRIYIGKYSGAEVEVDGKHYTIIGPEDVLAVIES